MSEAAPLLQPAATHRERVAAALDLAALPPVLRTLLTTDGTVTETLAALHGEEVGVRVLAQGFGPGVTEHLLGAVIETYNHVVFVDGDDGIGGAVEDP